MGVGCTAGRNSHQSELIDQNNSRSHQANRQCHSRQNQDRQIAGNGVEFNERFHKPLFSLDNTPR